MELIILELDHEEMVEKTTLIHVSLINTIDVINYKEYNKCIIAINLYDYNYAVEYNVNLSYEDVIKLNRYIDEICVENRMARLDEIVECVINGWDIKEILRLKV